MDRLKIGPLCNALYGTDYTDESMIELVRYRSRLIKISRPEFYTFYNGEADCMAETELRLPDVFKASEMFPDAEDNPMLELGHAEGIELMKKVLKLHAQGKDALKNIFSSYIDFDKFF